MSENNKYTIRLGAATIDLRSPKVMSIINATPDSFWCQSRNTSYAEIEMTVIRAVEEGTDMLDVGGYSSRPGADEVEPQEELRRIRMALEVIRSICPSLPVSLDTFRSEIATYAIEHFGPCIINDISAGELDPQMLSTVASLQVPYIAMHMRANPATMQEHASYGNIVPEVRAYFVKKLEKLDRLGIKDVIIDPGFGFAKTTEQNYELMAGLSEIASLGVPVLSGISRKSMIYKPLGKTPAEALHGTTALNWESLRQGASILRVHDTLAASDTVKIFEKYKACAG